MTGEKVSSTDSYTAIAVASAKLNHSFDLSMLRLGPETVKPIITIKQNDLVVEYTCFSAEMIGSWEQAEGHLSTDKNKFEIRTVAKPWNGELTYSCTSVFTRK